MTTHVKDFAVDIVSRLLAGSEKEEDANELGVHVEYSDLYRAVIFLTCIYCAGQFVSRVLSTPALVGEICCGILMGPQLADFVPNPEAFVLFGELGYVLSTPLFHVSSLLFLTSFLL